MNDEPISRLIDKREDLIARCNHLLKAYGDDAVLVTTRQNAMANDLWNICSDPKCWSVPLGGAFRLELVDMEAMAARDRLIKAA